jgi:hypothetical protein
MNVREYRSGNQKWTLENTEVAIKNEQSRETGSMGYTIPRHKYTTQYVLVITMRNHTQIM